MDEATIRALNALNRQFYNTTAAHFDRTRARPWAGWERLLPYLQKLPAPLRVLDVGCGNGRFGVFLAERLGAENIRYHGVDSAPELLARAREALANVPAQFEERDVLEDPLPSGEYVLVALFGVLHHIPSATRRRECLRQLAAHVAPNGYLVLTAWCFYEFERFRRRVQPWPQGLAREKHDYLLDWQRGAHAVRYCHYVDEAEHADLLAATGLEVLETFRADGHNGALNRYSILQRPAR